MEFKTLYDGSKVSALGVGTWHMGGNDKRDTTNDDKETDAIETAIELGVTHIDTAEFYGSGHAEELIGKAIKNHDRKKLFITTKVMWENLSYDKVIEAAKRSLSRLKTPYIDLYLIHFPNEEKFPIEETMRAMDFLVKQSITRFIGVSNFSVEQMKEAQEFSKNKIAVNQVEYNLIARNNGQFLHNVESKVLPFCQKNNILLTAYRPLAFGKLAKPGIRVLDEMAKKYNKTQAQVAIRWLLSQENVITIPKASNIDHLKENLGALGWKLEKQDIEKLNKMA